MAGPTKDRNEAFLKRWHRIVAEQDMDGLGEVLSEDVSLGVPPYWQRIEGRDTAQHLLGLVIQNIEGFTYYREWSEGNEFALEFRGRVGGNELQGIDLITLDDDGQLCRLDVMIRPVNAVIELRERIAPRMTEFLAQRAEAAASA